MDRFAEMETFVQVAERGSFAAAARALGRSQPAVSRIIGALEERLDTRLLIRTTRSLRLTESGERFIADCRSLLAQLAESEDAARGIHATPKGEIRITAPVMFGRLHLTPLLRRFLDRYPEVAAQTLFLDRNVNLIDEGLDVAFRIGALGNSGLIATRVGAVRRVCVSAPDYLERAGSPATIDDLERHRLIFASSVHATPEWIFEFDGKPIRRRIKPAVRMNANDSVIDLAVAGWGITQVLRYQVDRHLREGRLVEVLGPFAPPLLPVNILHQEGRQVSARVRAFVDFMAAELRREPAIRDNP